MTVPGEIRWSLHHFLETPHFGKALELWETCSETWTERDRSPETGQLPWGWEPWRQVVSRLHPWWGWGSWQDAEPPGRLREAHAHLSSSNLRSSRFPFLSRKWPRMGTQLWAIRHLCRGCFRFHPSMSIIPYTLSSLLTRLMDLWLNQQFSSAAPSSLLLPLSASFDQIITA